MAVEIGEVKAKLSVDTTELDCALAKAKELYRLRSEYNLHFVAGMLLGIILSIVVMAL